MTTTYTDGTITTSASEQTIFDVTADRYYATWIFTQNMTASETFVVKVYVKDQNAGLMRQYDSFTLTGDQPSDSFYIPYITTKEYKVTIQRTGGSDRAVTWLRADVADDGGSASSSSSNSETFTNKNIDLKDNNLALRAYTAIVFKVGSTYYARKYDGTLISSGAVAETVIQAAMDLHGNVFLTGHLSTPGFTSTNQIIFSGAFAGLNISEGDGLIIDKSTEIIIPNGYTGYFLKALDQGYFKVQLDGDMTEAGTPANNWTCFLLQSDNGGSGVIGAYIGGNGQVQNCNIFCELKSTGSGFINGNIFDGIFIDFSKIGFKFNQISSGPIHHNVFQNIIMEGTLGASSRTMFQNVSTQNNMIFNCFAEDFGPNDIAINFTPTSLNNYVIGGGVEFDGVVIDQGSRNFILGPWISQTQINRVVTTPDCFKVGTWHGASNAQEADGFINSRISSSVVGTGTKSNAADSTGVYMTMDTGATINSIYGNRLAFACLERINGCYFKTALYPNQITTSRIFAGFHSSTSAPVSSADPLNAASGVGLWFDSAVSANWKRMHNDGVGASIVDDTGVALTASTLYPVEIYAVNDTKFRFVFNGTSTNITTDIPASTTNLSFHIYIENLAAASKTVRCYYYILRTDK